MYPRMAFRQGPGRLFYCPRVMKKIECYIRESDVDPLVRSLSKTGIGGITVYPVQGFGRQKGKGEGVLMPRMKMEVFALDMEVEYVLGTILQVTRSHDFG